MSTSNFIPKLSARTLAFALALSLTFPANSAPTDIATSPITGTNAAQVKPNIMLLMDTSDSMAWGHMPDEVETVLGTDKIGYKSSQCNLLYYNPQTTYVLPKQANGVDFAAPSFDAAPYSRSDVYNPASNDAVNLSTSFQAFNDNTLRTTGYNDTPQPAYYYVHTGGNPITGYASAPCADTDVDATGTAADGGIWTRIRVSDHSGISGADERLNFAIWYTYYRTRINLIKSAASLAFTPLTDSFRVGFITMKPKDDVNPGTPVNGDKYLPIADFGSAQRGLWFDKLFSQRPKGTSPAREGLARVGRHYAGKHDGINTGMGGDPVQYSCQQNFTIMTTDGYWNDQDETAGAGPVMIDGITKVGQQDGTLTTSSGNTPRPIFDGVPSGFQTTTDKQAFFNYVPCGAYFNRTTSQVTQASSQTSFHTSQMTKDTSQVLEASTQYRRTTQQSVQHTSQTTLSSFQTFASTYQDRADIYQRRKRTVQKLKRTVTNLQATNQNLQSRLQHREIRSRTESGAYTTTQLVQIPRQTTLQTQRATYQALRTTTQMRMSTVQRLRTKRQVVERTSQTVKATYQMLRSTEQQLELRTQHLRSSHQNRQSTLQTRQYTVQISGTTKQDFKTTSRTLLSRERVFQTRTWTEACPTSGEVCAPVDEGTCFDKPGVLECVQKKTGPTLVAACTPSGPASSNGYRRTKCDTDVVTPETAVQTCKSELATATNSYVKTSCRLDESIPVAAICSPSGPTASNGWVTTTCKSYYTGPTYTNSCSGSPPLPENGFTETICTRDESPHIGVNTCTEIAGDNGNSYKATHCEENNTTNVPVQSCTAAPRSNSNQWTTVSCSPVDEIDQPSVGCVPADASVQNSWTKTTCRDSSGQPTPVATCSPSQAGPSNGYVEITCPPPNRTGPVGVQSCVALDANSGNDFTSVLCAPTTTTLPAGSCVPQPASAGNQWTETTCPPPVLGARPVANCVPSTPTTYPWITVTCDHSNDVDNEPVAFCNASNPSDGNGWTTTTCPSPNTTGPDPVPAASCTPDIARTGNNFTETLCIPNNVVEEGVPSCVASGEAPGTYITTTCPPPRTTGPVGVESCSPQTAASGNAYVEITCPRNDDINVAVASCTPHTAKVSNGWTTTTCPEPTTVSGPDLVDFCQYDGPTLANGFQVTTCERNGLGSRPDGSCVPQSPNASNGHVTIVCYTVGSQNLGIPNDCVPQSPSASNDFTTVTCPGDYDDPNRPVFECTPQTASASNGYILTTCPAAIKTGPTPVARCTPEIADADNNWTSRSCPPPITTSLTGAETCTPEPALSSNGYTETFCESGDTNEVSVPACTDQAAKPENGWTQTICRDNFQNDVSIAYCSSNSGPARAGNDYTRVTCLPPVVTTHVPVPNCNPATVPNTQNDNTITTCEYDNRLDVPAGNCQPEAPTPGNDFKTVICWPPVVKNVGVPKGSCVPDATPNSSNAWTTTSCTEAGSENTPVESCSASEPDANNGYTRTTCSDSNVAAHAVSVCNPDPGTLANNWKTTTCTPVPTSTPAKAGTCTPEGPGPENDWKTTTCPIHETDGYLQEGTCDDAQPSSSNSWLTRTCHTTSVAPTLVAKCTPATASSTNNWYSVICKTTTSDPEVVASCTSVEADASNGFTAVNCLPSSGKKIQYTLTTTVTSSAVSGGIPVGEVTSNTTSEAPVDLNGVCYGPTDNALPLPNPNPEPAGITVGPLPEAPCTTWPCVVSVNTNDPRSINSLADVAQYYYVTDLRPAADWPADISTNDVPSIGGGPEDDRVRWQHMTTFSIALGVSGSLNYRPDYRSASVTTGDFADIRTGAKNWPLWPDPALDYASKKSLWSNPKAIDDFWHAAVNGRGTFFSAANPATVVSGLAEALAGIQARLASGAAAGTSSLEPVNGNRFAYLANYTTQKWFGQVEAHEFNLTTGAIEAPVIWSAQSLLDAKVGNACDNRKIFLLRPGATDNLAKFTWDSKPCDGLMVPTGTADTGLNAAEKAFFSSAEVNNLSQINSMTTGANGTVDQRTLAAGANLVNFVRGQRGLEGFKPDDATKLYRTREHVLGDIVNAQPLYVQAPFASYGDAGYAGFKLANAGRKPMLYVAANDGMLHAFYAGTSTADTEGGKEAWSVIPATVLPSLYHLADNNYANIHRYSVDGTPAVSDISDATAGPAAWKTVLVAGLNGGGKGYYALDVTVPDAPKGLWEFKWDPSVCPSDPTLATGNSADCHLGYTFGKPLITKLANGTWVVMVTSGYNNVNASAQTGDGKGYLYVLNAATGKIIYKIATTAGDATTPSGLTQINNFVDQADISNLTVRVYGTDVLGNIWRFDVNDNMEPSGREASLIGTATDTNGTPQPFTTRPEISEIGGKPMVFVASGKLLGASDVTVAQKQTIYGIIDPLTGTPAFPDLRSTLAPLEMVQVGVGAGAYRTVHCTGSSVQCNSANGWYVDLPDTGERVNVEMKLRSGTLIVASNVPQNNACTTGGYSWLNFLNFNTGLAVNGALNQSVSEFTDKALIVGFTIVKLPGGAVKAIVSTSDGNVRIGSPAFAAGATSNIRRVSWREVAQ